MVQKPGECTPGFPGLIAGIGPSGSNPEVVTRAGATSVWSATASPAGKRKMREATLPPCVDDNG